MKRTVLLISTLLAFAISGVAQSQFPAVYPAQASRRPAAKHEKREKQQLKQHERSESAACRNSTAVGSSCGDLRSHQKAEKKQLKSHQKTERRQFRR